MYLIPNINSKNNLCEEYFIIYYYLTLNYTLAKRNNEEQDMSESVHTQIQHMLAALERLGAVI